MNVAAMADPLTLGSDRSADPKFARAERHSRRVRWLKVFLPVSALLIGAGFVGWSWLASPVALGFDLSSSAIRDGKLVMSDPRLEGFTTDNLPYSMTALRAVQDVADTNVIELEDIDASVPIDDGTTARIDARRATYDRMKNTIALADPMTLSTSDGKSATLQSAFIDMAAGTLVSDKPVAIRVDGASIDAESLSVAENGKVIVLERRVRMVLDPGRLNAERAERSGG